MAQWRVFYLGDIDPFTCGIPEPLYKTVLIICYVYSNRYGNVLNRLSHSFILIYINNSSVICYSERHNIVELSSFGSKFVALRISTELVEALSIRPNVLANDYMVHPTSSVITSL